MRLYFDAVQLWHYNVSVSCNRVLQIYDNTFTHVDQRLLVFTVLHLILRRYRFELTWQIILIMYFIHDICQIVQIDHNNSTARWNAHVEWIEFTKRALTVRLQLRSPVNRKLLDRSTQSFALDIHRSTSSPSDQKRPLSAELRCPDKRVQ